MVRRWCTIEQQGYGTRSNTLIDTGLIASNGAIFRVAITPHIKTGSTMTIDFLSALKGKASAIQATRKDTSKPVPTPNKYIPQTPTVKPHPVSPPYPKLPEAQIDRVEIVERDNRIDLYFTDKPTPDQRGVLKTAGWWFAAERTCWFHFDGEVNREFLRKTYNLDIDRKPESISLVAPADTSFTFAVPSPEITADQSDPHTEEPQEYLRFKVQVNELLTELKIDAADLMLIAINALHKVTFSKDS